MMKFAKVTNILLAVLVVLGLFARFWQLEQIPVYLYLDELDHVFVGEALARWGTDITGSWTPLQFRSAPAPNVLAELPAVFYAVVQHIFGFGLGHAHLVSAVSGLCAVAFSSISILLLFGSKKAATTTLAFTLVTPLLIYVSRMAYEATLSTTFQLLFILGSVVVVSSIGRSNWKTFIGIVLLFSGLPLAYYTYHGAKALLPFITITICMYLVVKLKSVKLSKWWYILPILLFVTQCLLLSQTLSLRSDAVSARIDTEMVFSEKLLSQEVNAQRVMSLDNLLKNAYINKPVILVRNFIAGYLVAYDLKRLFVTGYEGGFQFSLIVYSFLYISFVPLLVLGGVFFWKERRSLSVRFLVLLVLLAPVTTALTGGGQSIFRSQLLYYLLIMVCALGLQYLMEKCNQRNKSICWLVILCLLVIIGETILFSFQYFGRYPIVSAQNHYFSEELLTAYAGFTKQNITIVLSHPPYSEARSLVVGLGLMPALSISQRTQFKQSDLVSYDLGRILLSDRCVPLQPDQILIVDGMKLHSCNYLEQLASGSAQLMYSEDKQRIILPVISAPSDSGAFYYILQDSICKNQKFPEYVRATKIEQFNPSSLGPEEYCQTWVKSESFVL